MTDQNQPQAPTVTDEADIKLAREWIEDMKRPGGIPREDALAAARILEALLPAPPATLADELREWFNLHHMEYMDSFAALVHRVEAVEEELAGRKRDYAECQAELLEADRQRFLGRSEVQRLTAQVARQKQLIELHGVPRDTVVLPDVESTPTLPDPADVPPGEPWLVSTEGEDETLIGLRNHAGPHVWETVSRTTPNGGGWCTDAAVTLVARLAPERPAHTIDRAEGLDALPAKSVVLDRFDDVWQKDSDGDFQTAGCWRPSEKLIDSRGPVTVIYTPEETA